MSAKYTANFQELPAKTRSGKLRSAGTSQNVGSASTTTVKIDRSILPSDTAFFIRHPLNCETLSDGSYRFELSHGMGKRPTVTVTDAEMNEVKVDVQFPDDNTVVLTWSGDPLSGGEIYLV